MSSTDIEPITPHAETSLDGNPTDAPEGKKLPAPRQTPKGRRLMCFLDGTSNRAIDSKRVDPTNVFKLNQAFTYGFQGIPQITFYFSGVGTRGDVISRATGKGFDQIIMEAYIALSSNYMEGDTIYLFGFSRGAAAARALSEFISNPGLLHADCLRLFPTAWSYLTDKNLGDRQLNEMETELSDCLLHPKVEFLGLFDAVAGSSWDKARFFSTFRSSTSWLAPVVKNAVQVLSIDDNRNPSFSPLLWSGKAPSTIGQYLEQIWQPGVHADVGGCSNAVFLGNVALLTMIDRIQSCCPGLDWDHFFIEDLRIETEKTRFMKITSERPGIARKLLWPGKRKLGVGPNSCEYVHPLFNLLLNKEFSIRGKQKVYLPKNAPNGLKEALFSDPAPNWLKDACERVLAKTP